MDRKVVEVSSLSLSLSFSGYLPTYLPIYLCIYLSIYLPTQLSIYLSISLSLCLSVCLCLKTKLFCETSSIFEKRSNSARLPQFLNLITSKTKYILTSKGASRHNGMHFFDISTSKSCPKLRCFARLTWKCASRHNGMQFFISHLGSWLRTRRFSEPTFRPSGATNHWKNTVFATSYLFAHLHLLSSDSFSSLIFSLLLFSSLFFCSTSAFHLSILSEVWLLNFLRLWHWTSMRPIRGIISSSVCQVGLGLTPQIHSHDIIPISPYFGEDPIDWARIIPN